jgi:hypothetical protein
MNKLKVFLVVVISFIVWSGFTEAAKKKWTISVHLEKVKIMSTEGEKELPVKKDAFSNELMDINWSPEPKGFKFEIVNKKDTSILILWDKSYFIDEKGKKHKIVHSKFKFVDNPRPIESTTIASQASLKDLVYPQDYAIPKLKVDAVQPFSSGRQPSSTATYYEKKEWVKKDIFLKKVSLKKMKKMDQDFDINSYLENSRYEIRLKIKVKDKEQDYSFFFKSIEKNK